MRRIIAFNRVSADGYFSAPDGNLSWTVPDEELDRGVARNLDGPGTILFGRRTYEMFESFWPHALDDSGTAEDPHAAGRRSPEIRAMAEWINAAEKHVWSRTRGELTWRNSHLHGELDPREVRALKDAPGKDMMIFGSGSIVSLLTGHGLIDEYQFIVGPVLLGSGKTLISGVPSAVKLELVEATPFASGNVRLRYVRAGQ
ncbi:MAG TPA: dihydrofolate reductase family protein [Longimicrobium sp.]|nr:dihydrofolate reductase family protein [Longimicrobium sp.]